MSPRIQVFDDLFDTGRDAWRHHDQAETPVRKRLFEIGRKIRDGRRIVFILTVDIAQGVPKIAGDIARDVRQRGAQVTCW